MKILAIADEESKFYWDYYEPGKLDDIDLIISCGDLKPAYLSFLATFTHAPVLYVPENHDDIYATNPPEGCINIDNKIYVHEGVRILGLGGSFRYKPGNNQYTEEEMKLRIGKMKLKIGFKKGFDILVTHAAIAGFNDGEDLPHKGFSCFEKLIRKYKPKYHLHGHMHKTYGNFKRISTLDETTIINAYERYVFEYPDSSEPNK